MTQRLSRLGWAAGIGALTAGWLYLIGVMHGAAAAAEQRITAEEDLEVVEDARPES